MEQAPPVASRWWSMRPSLVPLLTLVALGTLIQGCSDKLTSSQPEPAASAPSPHEASDGIVYTVVEETIYDKPIKTQIEQHILATPPPTKDQLRAQLQRQYEAALERRGFEYHNPATNIYIYIYGSQEQAQVREGLWIGMIAKSPMDHGEPTPDINDDRLAALGEKPEDRFGLTQEERKAAFKAMVAAEDQAQREAMEQIPDTAVFKQIDLDRKLQVRYKAVVARKYRLSTKQLTEIGIEGVTKGWPR